MYIYVSVFCSKFVRLLLYINFFFFRVNKNVDEKNLGLDKSLFVVCLCIDVYVFEGLMVIKLDCE